MFQNKTKKGIRISILLLLVLGILGTSFMTDFPIPTEETEAGILHYCCEWRCFVDGLGRIRCFPINCRHRIHWPGFPPPC